MPDDDSDDDSDDDESYAPSDDEDDFDIEDEDWEADDEEQNKALDPSSCDSTYRELYKDDETARANFCEPFFGVPSRTAPPARAHPCPHPPPLASLAPPPERANEAETVQPTADGDDADA
ncbi:hypothetical protein THAOC_35587, partial [Thalassiosira oceanica]